MTKSVFVYIIGYYSEINKIMVKILITGGAGFIGSHLAEKLLEQGNEIFIIDNLSTGSMDNIKHLMSNERFNFTEGSVLDEDLMAGMIKGKDQIYHLAAAVGVKQILGKPLKSLLTNIKGTEIVLQEAEKHKIKVLVASTSEVCGKGDKMPFKEDDDRTYGSVYNDRWVYAFSKAVDEFLALAYWREKKLPVAVVRLFNVIGPRQTGVYGMVVPTFVKQALKGDDITVYGDMGSEHGEQCRCFADVDDVIGALIKLMAEEKAEGQVVNIGSDEEISMNELAEKVKEWTGSDSEIRKVSYQEAYPEGYEDFKRRVPGLEKVKELIDYEPKIDLEQSVKKIIEYQKTKLK